MVVQSALPDSASVLPLRGRGGVCREDAGEEERGGDQGGEGEAGGHQGREAEEGQGAGGKGQGGWVGGAGERPDKDCGRGSQGGGRGRERGKAMEQAVGGSEEREGRQRLYGGCGSVVLLEFGRVRSVGGRG